ncbi:phosphoribosylaminoimidazolecarboxamide formyltransferase/IMP cyclohydrolase [Kribbella amoyensis]|uniref:Phosphoribosylaminoimidazolecarboxamide formyltransferase/IMP cyclohydrolase n=1 Tax=Kribbella amoyensis TaxID=996641 RepID=A0A561BZ42_9ACTN|nr:5-aminoimidazole-4-carboxamide ribonucleotide transformylase [Kribbella amoyensis]TWD84186.1 phosphoribosylaminoimidazolecarboxamide formyltransferase/IMP cyclohydrolase [Kribbella amoyensis]
MRYGMNPHQSASIVAGQGPRVLNGEPSMINYLDALNAFELVREADLATGKPAAASFKHVSPAGAAVAGTVDPAAANLWRVTGVEPDSLLSAYVRARDADPKSSFGDVVALSRPVDPTTAEFLRTVICDAVIAPGFEPGTAAALASKRGGRFLVLEADTTCIPPAVERRDVLGLTIEQERDAVPIASVLPDGGALRASTRADALLGLVTLRYTQSNSVAFVRDGAAIGIGAGQQNRVDCVRLAAAKARTWWLRRHPFVDHLTEVDEMGRQDRLNWQLRFAGQEMTTVQLSEFATLFGDEARRQYDEVGWRDQWIASFAGVTMTSDGYLPFSDNVEYAAAAGVSTIVEPGGSLRTNEIVACAATHGIEHVQTGLRLFHH